MALAVDSAKWIIKDILQNLRRVEEALSIVGLLYLGNVSVAATWDLLKGVRTHLWPRLFRRNFVKEYGAWAGVWRFGSVSHKLFQLLCPDWEMAKWSNS